MAIYPSFALPDFGGVARQLGEDLITAMNAQTQRQYAENQQRREASRDAAERAKLAREEADAELKQKERAFSALPGLMRMARQSPEMANANPYGWKVESQVTEPPPVQNFPALPMFAQHEQPPEATKTDARGNWVPPEMPTRPEGPVTPEHALPFDEPVQHEAAPTPDISPEVIKATTPVKHVMFSGFGQRFEAPEHQTLAVNGQDFGQTYDAFLEETGDPIKALGLAKSVWEGRQKAADVVANREDTQNFGREMNLNRTDKLSEADKNRAAKAAAAKKKGGGGGAVNPAMAELIRMKEDRQPDSLIAARAAELRIPMGGKTGYLQAIKEVRSASNADARLGEKRAQETFVDDNGNPVVGINSKLAGKAADANVAFQQVQARLKHLLDDVNTNGTRVMPWDIAGARNRESAMKEVVAALRKYNELSATDASVKLEEAITAGGGTVGDGFIAGAQPQILQHLLDEATVRHNEQLKNYSRPAASASPAGVTRVAMPDGTVQEFDSTGKRIK